MNKEKAALLKKTRSTVRAHCQIDYIVENAKPALADATMQILRAMANIVRKQKRTAASTSVDTAERYR